jgi:hypothetical protein
VERGKTVLESPGGERSFDAAVAEDFIGSVGHADGAGAGRFLTRRNIWHELKTSFVAIQQLKVGDVGAATNR